MLLLAGWFASEVIEGETLAFDNAVRDQVHALASPAATQIMIGLSFVGSPTFLTCLGLIVAVAFILLKWWRALLLFLITMAGEIILDSTLKGFYERARPAAYFNYLLPKSYSFPSGHAFGSFCFFGIVAWLITSRLKDHRVLNWSTRLTAAILILLIGLSRVYLGVHYPTDVIAGYMTGTIWTFTVILSDAYFRHYRAKKAGRPAN